MPGPKPELLDKEIEDYLRLKSGRTITVYRTAFRIFLEYYHGKYGEDKGVNHFMDRIFDKLKKPRREQEPRLIERELVEYIDYLKNLPPKGRRKNKGLSNNTIRVYIAAMQNFLKYRNIMVSTSFIGNTPKPIPQKRNHKHEWSIDDIRQFVDASPTYRDKAIILCLFQSGLGVNELCNLDYGDVQDELEKSVVPIHLRLHRQKTGIEFRTFFGRDAVKYLRLYLDTRANLTPDKPLFTKWNSDKARITDGAIEMKFREIAKTLDFIEERDLQEGFNPARPHSLRAAFRTQLTNKIADILIEFFMGHKIPEQERAYINFPTEELRELYMNAEKYLAIEKTSRDEMIERKTAKSEAKDEIVELRKTLEELTSKNAKLAQLVKTLVERMNEFEAFKMAVLDEDMEMQSRELFEKKP